VACKVESQVLCIKESSKYNYQAPCIVTFYTRDNGVMIVAYMFMKKEQTEERRGKEKAYIKNIIGFNYLIRNLYLCSIAETLPDVAFVCCSKRQMF
jgi:hypothetical protein